MNNFKLSITILIVLIILFILWVFFNIITRNDKIASEKYDLEKDGVVILKNVFSNDEIQYLKRECEHNHYQLLKTALIGSRLLGCLREKLPIDKRNEYVLHDYIWIIKKSSVHTCHRDNNGDFFNAGQKYPSYTILIYLEDMEKCLGLFHKVI